MAAKTRVYVPIGTKEYARLWGVSERTARRRIAATAGAAKTARGWKAPILATDYAKRSGKSISTVRKGGLKAASPTDLKDVILGRNLSNIAKARGNAKTIIVPWAKARPRYSEPTIEKRLEYANPTQLARIGRMTQREWEAIISDKAVRESSDWEGSDGDTILYYH